jgi:hypothetical protein
MAEGKIPRLKGDKRYTDAPRFKIIYEYEGAFKAMYEKYLEDAIRAFSAKYKKIIEGEKK